MNLAAVDLNLLTAFEALMGERNVTRAGARIGLSQPAMSAALRRLRDLVGDPLLVRAGGAMHPTPRAIELAGPVHEALAQIRLALGPRAFDPASAQQRFNLTTADYSELVILPGLMRALAGRAPGVDLRVVNSDRVSGVELVESGDADIAIMPFPHGVSHLRTCTLFHDSHHCIAAEGRTDFARGMTLEAYAAASHVVASVEGRGTSNVDSALAALGLSRRIGLAVPHFLVIPHVVAASAMIATVPSRLAQAFAGNGLALFAPPLALEDFSVQLVWHQRRDRDPAHLWLRDLIAEICAGCD